MIFHFSIGADDPRRTATMLAELWRGEAFHFPMVGEGSWVVMPATSAARRSKSIRAISRFTRPR